MFVTTTFKFYPGVLPWFSFILNSITAELQHRFGPPSGAPYPYGEYKGNPWTDFLMVIMARGIACGHVHTTTAVDSRNMAAMLWQRNALSVSSGSMPSFLCGIFKENETNDSGSWSNNLHWSKRKKQKARINKQRSSERELQVSAGEGGKIVVRNAMNYSRDRERRWNDTNNKFLSSTSRADRYGSTLVFHQDVRTPPK